MIQGLERGCNVVQEKMRHAKVRMPIALKKWRLLDVNESSIQTFSVIFPSIYTELKHMIQRSQKGLLSFFALSSLILANTGCSDAPDNSHTAPMHRQCSINSQSLGTSPESAFPLFNKIYYLFGANQNKLPTAYSNLLGTSIDSDPSDCLDIDLVTMKKTFPTKADFFKQEIPKLVQIAREFGVSSSQIEDFFSGKLDINLNFELGQGKDKVDLGVVLHNRVIRTLNSLKPNKARDFYGRIMADLAQIGYSFHKETGCVYETEKKLRYLNSTEYQTYSKTAKSDNLSTTQMSELVRDRYLTILDSIDHDHPRQLMASRSFPDESETIPSSGIALEKTTNQEYQAAVHFYSVKTWFENNNCKEYHNQNISEINPIKKDDPNRWIANYAGWALSRDGLVFERMNNFFSADSNFIQASIIKNSAQKDDPYLYLFGTPAGGDGDLRLARFRPESILSKDKYEYCDPENENCNWIKNPKETKPLANRIGKFSVQFHQSSSSWILLHSRSESRYREVIMRKSSNLFDWKNSKERVLFVCESGSRNDNCHTPFTHTALFQPGMIYYLWSGGRTDDNVSLAKTPSDFD